MRMHVTLGNLEVVDDIEYFLFSNNGVMFIGTNDSVYIVNYTYKG